MNDQEKLEAAYDILSTNLEWIRGVDTKGTLLFIVSSAMVGAIAGISSNARDLTWPGAVAGILQIVCIISIAAASFPRLAGKNDSAIYFGSITAIDEDTYVQKILGSDTASLLKDFAKQSYRNAFIAKEKYKFICYATISLFLSLPFWLAAIWLYGSRITQGH